MTDDTEKVIDMAEAKKKLSPDDGVASVRRAPRQNYCRHTSVLLRDDDRRLECKDCEADVDPFAFLGLLASQEAEWRYVSGEILRKRKELAEIKREIRNAKARLARARKSGQAIARVQKER